MLLSSKELVELGLNGGDGKLYARAAVTIFLMAFLFTTGTHLADYVWILLFGQ